MTSSQDTLGKLVEARQGIRAALKALGQVPTDTVPRVTIDGIQHQLREVEERLHTLQDDLAPARKQTSSDQE